jgi:hypothetical protein
MSNGRVPQMHEARAAVYLPGRPQGIAPTLAFAQWAGLSLKPGRPQGIAPTSADAFGRPSPG